MAYLRTIENVFEEWATALSGTEIADHVYMEQPNETVQFPCASLLPLPSPEQGYDLDNEAAGIELTVQVDVYVRETATLKKLYELNAVSHNALCALGFRMTVSNTPLMYSGYKRLTTRYSRMIGYGEQIAN